MYRRLRAAAIAMVAVLGAGACSNGGQPAAAGDPTTTGRATGRRRTGRLWAVATAVDLIRN